jgi:hypothetical protein
MSEPLGLPEKVLGLERTLAAARIAHAFGGAIALAYYAEPRATDDIDINVFVSTDEHRRVVSVLAPLGIESPPAEDAGRDGQIRMRWGASPVDVFYSNLTVHEAMKQATRVVPFADSSIPILSPEHLVVCKVAFNRPQDWLDIEKVLAITPVDREEIDRWVADLTAPTDPRAVRLRELEDRLLGPPA